MSSDINISITNNQNVTSTLTNQNDVANLSGANTFIIPSRRTVFLLASDPSFAVTSNGENTPATIAPFTGAPNQIFLTNFDLFQNSLIVSTQDNQLLLAPLIDSPNNTNSPVGIIRSLATPLPGPPSDNGGNGGGSLPPNRSVAWMTIQPAQPVNNGLILALPPLNNRLSILPQGSYNFENSPLFLTQNELQFIITFIL